MDYESQLLDLLRLEGGRSHREECEVDLRMFPIEVDRQLYSFRKRVDVHPWLYVVGHRSSKASCQRVR